MASDVAMAVIDGLFIKLVKLKETTDLSRPRALLLGDNGRRPKKGGGEGVRTFAVLLQYTAYSVHIDERSATQSNGFQPQAN